MSPSELSAAVLGLAVISGIGRTLLAYLPPGGLGAHRLGDLPSTWAASHVLGTVAIAAGASLAALLALPVHPLWIAGIAAVLALARWAFLPGKLVPRHEVARERAGPVARALTGLALGLIAWACASTEILRQEGLWAIRAQAWLSEGWLVGLEGPPTSRGALASVPLATGAIAFLAWPLGVVTELSARIHLFTGCAATLVLAERAMATARRAPLGRRACVLLLAAALVPALDPEDGDVALASLCALSVTGLVAWTRRADARGLAVACLGLCAMPLARPGGWAMALAGIFALLVATPRPSLVRALAWCLASAAALAFPWPVAAWHRGVALLGRDPLADLSSGWSLSGPRADLWVAPIWIAAGAAVGPACIALFRRPAGPGAPRAEADRPRRDLGVLLAFLAVLFLAAAGVTLLSGSQWNLVARTWAPALLVAAAPLAAVLAARGLLPAEQPA